MGKVLLEVCCGSADDVIQACKAGADRVELNCDLFHGGLTPTLGALIAAKREADIPVVAMVRPREGGFCYTGTEFAAAVEDGKLLLSHGADGLAFGFLLEDGTLDVERTRILVNLAREAEKDAVFHRAIDVVPDWREALDTLIQLGVTRVLTSGQEPNVPQGAQTIREMVDYAAGRIEILPGGASTPGTWIGWWSIPAAARCTCPVTGRFQTPQPPTAGGVHFGSCLYPPEDQYRVVDGDYISGVAARLN